MAQSKARTQPLLTGDALPRDLTVAEVCSLLDVPEWCVVRWCVAGLIPGARVKRSVWVIPRRGLFFFCGRQIEPMYSAEMIAGIAGVAVATARDWLKKRRLKSVKFGVERSAPRRVPESELRRWLAA